MGSLLNRLNFLVVQISFINGHPLLTLCSNLLLEHILEFLCFSFVSSYPCSKETPIIITKSTYRIYISSTVDNGNQFIKRTALTLPLSSLLLATTGVYERAKKKSIDLEWTKTKHLYSEGITNEKSSHFTWHINMIWASSRTLKKFHLMKRLPLEISHAEPCDKEVSF